MKFCEESMLHLYKGPPSKEQLKKIGCDEHDVNGAKSEGIFWLNTPGPIYTTQTDNCGTGQPEAPNNVGGDENYYEFIFKQPTNTVELNEIKNAANIDPFDGYYFDGNDYWTNKRIITWWSKIDTVIEYMINRYKEELQLPLNAHNTLFDFGKGPEEAHFFGPITPMPKNYKSALDFYQTELKNYLEWYMVTNNKSVVKLSELNYDWSEKIELDEKLKTFNPQTRDLVREYKNSNPNQSTLNKKKGFWDRVREIIK